MPNVLFWDAIHTNHRGIIIPSDGCEAGTLLRVNPSEGSHSKCSLETQPSEERYFYGLGLVISEKFNEQK